MTENKLVVDCGWEASGMEAELWKGRVEESEGRVRKLLVVVYTFVTWIVMMASQVCMYVKQNQSTLLKYVQFIVYQIFINKAVSIYTRC